MNPIKIIKRNKKLCSDEKKFIKEKLKKEKNNNLAHLNFKIDDIIVYEPYDGRNNNIYFYLIENIKKNGSLIVSLLEKNSKDSEYNTLSIFYKDISLIEPINKIEQNISMRWYKSQNSYGFQKDFWGTSYRGCFYSYLYDKNKKYQEHSLSD